MSRISKRQLVDLLHEKLTNEPLKQNSKNLLLTKQNLNAIIDTFIDTLKEELDKNNEVSIVEFGTFVRKEYSARDLKPGGLPNLKGIKVIKVPKYSKVLFKASKTLRK